MPLRPRPRSAHDGDRLSSLRAELEPSDLYFDLWTMDVQGPCDDALADNASTRLRLRVAVAPHVVVTSLHTL